MEEERARQEAANKGSSSAEGGTAPMVVDTAENAPVAGGPVEDDMLARALAMSMGQGGVRNRHHHIRRFSL